MEMALPRADSLRGKKTNAGQPSSHMRPSMHSRPVSWTQTAPAPALLMGTPPPSASFCQKRPFPPTYQRSPSPPLRSWGLDLAQPFMHIRSRRYRNGIAWRLPSKTVIHLRPSAGKKKSGQVSLHAQMAAPCRGASNLIQKNITCPQWRPRTLIRNDAKFQSMFVSLTELFPETKNTYPLIPSKDGKLKKILL